MTAPTHALTDPVTSSSLPPSSESATAAGTGEEVKVGQLKKDTNALDMPAAAMPSSNSASNSANASSAPAATSDSSTSAASKKMGDDKVDEDQEADVYTVSDIHVDVTAPSAIDAMNTAKQSAVKTGFTTLLNRIITKSDRSKIPVYNAEMVAKFINKLKIDKEKISDTRYMADVTVSFNAESIRKYLDSISVQYVDTQAPLMGLILIYKNGYESTLCTPMNAWCDAWQGLDLKNSVTPLFVIDKLQQRFEDKEIISRVINKEAGALDEIARRYDVSSLVIAAFSNTSSSEFQVTLEHYVPVTGFDQKINNTVKAAPIATTAPFQAQMLLSMVEDMWKDKTLTVVKEKDASNFLLTIDCAFKSIEEWQAMSKALRSQTGVTKVTVKALSVHGASLEVAYTGTLSTLGKKLLDQGFSLTRNGPNWKLSKLGGEGMSRSSQLSEDAGPQQEDGNS